jgi:hypothetical protein
MKAGAFIRETREKDDPWLGELPLNPEERKAILGAAACMRGVAASIDKPAPEVEAAALDEARAVLEEMWRRPEPRKRHWWRRG